MVELIAIGDESGHTSLYDVKRKSNHIKQLEFAHRFDDNFSPVASIKFSSDGRYVFVTQGPKIYQFSTEYNCNLVRRFEHPQPIPEVPSYLSRTNSGLCFNEQGNMFYAFHEKYVRLWDLREKDVVRTRANKYQANLTCIDLIKQKDVIVLGDASGHIQSWNVARTNDTDTTDHHMRNNSIFSTAGIIPPRRLDQSIMRGGIVQPWVESIGASNDGTWVCAGTSSGKFEHFTNSTSLLGFEAESYCGGHRSDALIKCIFPPNDPSGFPVFLHPGAIAGYVPANPEIRRPESEWSIDVVAQLGGNFRLCSCATNLDGNLIYAGTDDGKVLICDIATKEKKWLRKTSVSNNSSAIFAIDIFQP